MDNKQFSYFEVGDMHDAMLAARYSDRATELQVICGKVLAASILVEPVPSDAMRDTQMVLHAAASGLDVADGELKNFAVKKASRVLFGTELNIRKNKPDRAQWRQLKKYGINDEPRKDEQGDKEYFYDVTGALVVREYMAGHTKTSAALATNVAISSVRDKLKSNDRQYAQEHNLDTHARKWGKVKTLLHRTGMGVLLSRAGKYSSGRAAAVGIISLGTAFGLHDFRLYHKDIKHEKARMGL